MMVLLRIIHVPYDSPFTIHSTMAFSVCTDMYNHHQQQLKRFSLLQKEILQQLAHISPPHTKQSCSTFHLYKFASSGHSIQME